MTVRPVFSFEDRKYHVGSLKVREVEELETKLGVSYQEISPLGRMNHKLGIMALFLSRDHAADKVEAIIEGLELDAVEAMWSLEDDDLPDEYQDGIPVPKEGAAPSTPTS